MFGIEIELRVERHSNIYKPLGISDVYYCLVIKKTNLNLREQKWKGGMLPNA